MTRAYYRVDPDRYDRLIAKGYSDGAIAASDGVLSKAEKQAPRGRFANELVLKGHLNRRHWRYLPFLFNTGELVRLPDGVIYVDGWDEWQEGDYTVADRQARIRSKRKEASIQRDTSNGVERDASNAPDRDGSVAGARSLAVSGEHKAESGKPLARARAAAPTPVSMDADELVICQAWLDLTSRPPTEEDRVAFRTMLIGATRLDAQRIAKELRIKLGERLRSGHDVPPARYYLRRIEELNESMADQGSGLATRRASKLGIAQTLGQVLGTNGHRERDPDDVPSPPTDPTAESAPTNPSEANP